LTLLVARALALRFRSHLTHRSFPFVWAGFMLLTLALMAGLWALHCLLDATPFDPRNSVFRAVLTVAIFPAASLVLGRGQRALIGA
jgi:ABC-type uncharacterized transport system permease subunit